jgi:competence protein ComGC
MTIKSIKKNSEGFTLVELLIYIAGLLALGSVLTLLVVQFYSMYKEIVSIPRADRTGLLLVDRITKEIRSASQIDLLESQFNNINGVLDLDSVIDEDTVEKKFYIEDGIVKYQEDSEDPVNLSSKDFTVSNFNFTLVQTPISEAVKFDMELQFQTRNATQTKSYTGFAIIRESYE